MSDQIFSHNLPCHRVHDLCDRNAFFLFLLLRLERFVELEVVELVRIPSRRQCSLTRKLIDLGLENVVVVA